MKTVQAVLVALLLSTLVAGALVLSMWLTGAIFGSDVIQSLWRSWEPQRYAHYNWVEWCALTLVTMLCVAETAFAGVVGYLAVLRPESLRLSNC